LPQGRSSKFKNIAKENDAILNIQRGDFSEAAKLRRDGATELIPVEESVSNNEGMRLHGIESNIDKTRHEIS